MSKKSEISPHIVAQMVALRQEGLMQIAISKRLGVSQSVISRALKRDRDTGKFDARKRHGRPRCTTSRTDAMIRQLAVVDPTTTSTNIQSQLPPQVKVSKTTIKRRLHNEFGLKAYRPAAKPMLSKKNIKDRLSFCRRYRHWTTDQWRKVLFSDESTVKQFSSVPAYIRRPAGERYSAKYVKPTVKHSTSVMVWGSISGEGRGGLWFLPKGQTMNTANYLRFWRTNFHYGGGDIIVRIFNMMGRQLTPPNAPSNG